MTLPDLVTAAEDSRALGGFKNRFATRISQKSLPWAFAATSW